MERDKGEKKERKNLIGWGIGVALAAIGLLMFWRRRTKSRNLSEEEQNRLNQHYPGRGSDRGDL